MQRMQITQNKTNVMWWKVDKYTKIHTFSGRGKLFFLKANHKWTEIRQIDTNSKYTEIKKNKLTLIVNEMFSYLYLKEKCESKAIKAFNDRDTRGTYSQMTWRNRHIL